MYTVVSTLNVHGIDVRRWVQSSKVAIHVQIVSALAVQSAPPTLIFLFNEQVPHIVLHKE